MFVISFVNKYIFGVGVPIFLIALGLFYCFKLRFFHFLHPVKTAKVLLGGNREERISSLKALTLALASSSCASIPEHRPWANSPDPEQKMQPPVPSVPSRLGQVNPPSNDSLYTLQPNLAR